MSAPPAWTNSETESLNLNEWSTAFWFTPFQVWARQVNDPYEILEQGRQSLRNIGRMLIPWHLKCAECDKDLQFMQWQHWRSDRPDVTRFGWRVQQGKLYCPAHGETHA